MFTILEFIAGVALVVFGADVMVRGAARLAAAIGVSALVIGLTVVAYGTSAPELAVTVQAAWVGQPSLALGNVVGSNICNTLLIIGLSAAAAPLIVDRQIVRFDLWVMLGAAVLVLLFGLDGMLGRLDGIILFAIAIAYTVWSVTHSRRQTRAEREAVEQLAGEVKSSYAWALNLGLFVAGLGMLVLGSNWLVGSSVTFAQWLGVSELIIGLTIVAIGTSLPEVAVSVVASMKGERDIAVGNVVGSNVFNVVSVLGLTVTVAPAGIGVPAEALRVDIPIMLGVMALCVPLFVIGRRVTRWEGILLLIGYAGYLGLQVWFARQPVN